MNCWLCGTGYSIPGGFRDQAATAKMTRGLVQMSSANRVEKVGQVGTWNSQKLEEQGPVVEKGRSMLSQPLTQVGTACVVFG